MKPEQTEQIDGKVDFDRREYRARFRPDKKGGRPTINAPLLLPTATAAAKKFALVCKAEVITAAANAVEVTP